MAKSTKAGRAKRAKQTRPFIRALAGSQMGKELMGQVFKLDPVFKAQIKQVIHDTGSALDQYPRIKDLLAKTVGSKLSNMDTKGKDMVNYKGYTAEDKKNIKDLITTHESLHAAAHKEISDNIKNIGSKASVSVLDNLKPNENREMIAKSIRDTLKKNYKIASEPQKHAPGTPEHLAKSWHYKSQGSSGNNWGAWDAAHR